MNKLEKELERQCKDYAKSKGILFLKLKLASENGFPDRTLIFPYGTVLFVEFKTPKGRLRPEQKDWIWRLNRVATIAVTIDNLADFMNTVNDVLLEDLRRKDQE